MPGTTASNMSDIAGAGPVGDEKGQIMNLAMDDGLASQLGVDHPFNFWFKPEPVRETIGVNYNKMHPLGMSHGYHTYQGTGNTQIEFELYVNRLMMLKEGMVGSDGEPGQTRTSDTEEATVKRLNGLTSKILSGRKYLQALTVPPQMPVGVIGGSPPPAILVLPGILTLRVRVLNVVFSYTESDYLGNISEMRVKLTFEEAPVSRITMQDVLERGPYRTWGLL